MQKPKTHYLNSVLSQLGPEALLGVAGLRSSQSTRAQIRVRALSEPGVHPAGVIQLTDGEVTASLFAKMQHANYAGAQSLERELHLLSSVAPLITAEDSTLRSPLPAAYYPESHLLIMEFVPGDSLKHHLFDITLDSTARGNLAELLLRAGRWLGSLHRLTRKNTDGNPLEWLLQEFDSTKTREAFRVYSLQDTYNDLLAILKKCLDANPAFRRNLCEVHGEFTPIHVMVVDDAIYVVDFANSRTGYAYEDVGLFESFYDSLLPWRAFAGSCRIKLETQKQLFLRGYFERSGEPFFAADRAVMRWVRLISFARMLNGGQSRYSGWTKRAYSQIALPTLHKRFVRICRAELAALTETRPDIFDEDAYPKQASGYLPCAHHTDIERPATA